ncbi:uncharacterized protein LOC124957065 [Vespa velutina]|uniref:uncharacterized protein LOC124957065 n=1 Tax=Vespa velutina TaxID=202808 RepID=UPI001FB48CAB|nr:uncharacterized protein LOC124957065 [Vespa velutina]
MSTPGRLKLRSKNRIKEKINNNELIFEQSINVQEQEKIKELWKFLDLQCDLQPFKPLQSRNKLSLCSSKPNRPYDLFEKSKQFVCDKTSILKSTSSSDEDLDKKRIWYHGLRFFQKIGLDKAVLFKDKCKFCLAEKDLEEMNTDYTDTISQTYDELKAEMASFENRLAIREVENLNILKN